MMQWDKPSDDGIPPREPGKFRPGEPPMGVKGWIGWILAILQAVATAINQII